MANALRRRGATVICITDPGPDPDDAKALLLLAMAHKHAHINLAAVIANGGGRPARRAQLARLILDRVGEPAVPVGIGSAGIPIPEQPYECAMRGYDAVSLARLLDGKALLARTLSRASTRSLTMLLISGLRDFADFVTSQPGLVLRKVRTVTIQGGLISNAASPFGYVPDTSQNNAYDPAAAELVYNFCFTHGIRMNVVSRDAVPVRLRCGFTCAGFASCGHPSPNAARSLLLVATFTATTHAARALVCRAHRVRAAALPRQRAIPRARRLVAKTVRRPATRAL